MRVHTGDRREEGQGEGVEGVKKERGDRGGGLRCEGAGPPESHQSSAVHPVQVPQGRGYWRLWGLSLCAMGVAVDWQPLEGHGWTLQAVWRQMWVPRMGI